MIALVSTAAGAFAVDLEDNDVEACEPFVASPAPVLNLPRVVAAAAAGWHAVPVELPEIRAVALTEG